MNGNLAPDILIALGIVHQIRYPLYYIKKLKLACTEEQKARLAQAREETGRQLEDSALAGRYRERRIDDLTFINFADLILGNPKAAAANIEKIRNSLTIPKDGQAVFADLEKVYLYRYVFTKGVPARDAFAGLNLEGIPDREVHAYAVRIQQDHEDRYRANTLYQDLLLWIAREYRNRGIVYAEISDTGLLNRAEFPAKLRQIHEILPSVQRETGVLLRFLAGIRRIPLTIIRDQVTPNDYLAENLRCLRAIADDPYVAGSDIIGEEINDILELRGVIRELTRIAQAHPGFVIRIHAGENDSLRDNVANSIRCVAEALDPGLPVPPLRIGHGLYTCDLRSAKGEKLLEDMRKYGVTLEFQITSNVRLNNLSRLNRHPLRQYLHSGVRCVQGTDGGALYGTNSIDEELSLEKLLGLTVEELREMRRAEDVILSESLKTFEQRREQFLKDCAGGDAEIFYNRRLEATEHVSLDLWRDSSRLSAEEYLKDRMQELPENMLPVVVCGGSFNSDRRRTAVRKEDRELIDRLLAAADPDRIFFVTGHTLSGQEGYLVSRAAGRFRVFSIVPNRLSRAELNRLLEAGTGILISIESSGMGLYKSFAYEIFRRMPSVVLAFDGNSAALNLIQEARNGREKSRILINLRSAGLKAKAKLLEGYVQPLRGASSVLEAIAVQEAEE